LIEHLPFHGRRGCILTLYRMPETRNERFVEAAVVGHFPPKVSFALAQIWFWTDTRIPATFSIALWRWKVAGSVF